MKRCFLCKRKHVQEHMQNTKYTLTYHRFPKNIETRLLWIKACNLNENIDDVSALFICSLHFAIDDYVDLSAKQFGGLTRLKPGAVPQTKLITNKLPSLRTCISKQELVSADTDATQIFTHLPGTSSNLVNKEPNMFPLVSETYVCQPNAAFDSLDLPATNSEGETNCIMNIIHKVHVFQRSENSYYLGTVAV
ncbi:uncharacterized protein LOC108916766 isoform X2 [Anoplophora glabripennis]|uniref:uncharacterized protein LOC108916766 isoform X2 n=1 Tax=Anoplophora glabripennis TaxID=217634 RepID=UPI000873EE5B|nr:uncharacterized protein LOC108916766 isoform X2 [Anoplophora glabripennis]